MNNSNLNCIQNSQILYKSQISFLSVLSIVLRPSFTPYKAGAREKVYPFRIATARRDGRNNVYSALEKKNCLYYRNALSKSKNSTIGVESRKMGIDNLEKFWNQCFDKGQLKAFVFWFLKNYGENKTVSLVEKLKETGFKYATKAGVSIGIDDLKIPLSKALLIAEAEKQTSEALREYGKGNITGVERFQKLMDTWHRTSELLKQEVIQNFEATDTLNPVYMMAFSGARGNVSQVRQLVGMRGLMADPQGQIIDFPIRSNFREGLTLTEYIISSYGARKGIVDTALRTANAGYLTRRLVDVAQHVIVAQFDCETQRGIFVTSLKEGNKTLYSLQNRIVGRVLAKDLFFKENIIAYRNQEVSVQLASKISLNFQRVFIRSPLTCETKKLVCQLCYGWSLAQGNLVSIGEAVGIIAAQSIGEPGTQLTMRTFHTGGVFSGDVTDQIIAPFDGFVEYSAHIPGTLIRTQEGKLAFLTKSDGSFILKPGSPDLVVPPVITNSSDSTSLFRGRTQSSETNAPVEKNFENQKAYKIPAYTVLFIRNREKFLDKQVLAQISLFSKQKKQRDDEERSMKSEMEGEVFHGHMNVLEQINDYAERKFESWDWGYTWVLAGKVYRFPISSHLFPKVGDLISKESPLNRIHWFISDSCSLEVQSFVNSRFKKEFKRSQSDKQYLSSQRLSSPFTFTTSNNHFGIYPFLSSFEASSFIPNSSGARVSEGIQFPQDLSSIPLFPFSSLEEGWDDIGLLQSNPSLEEGRRGKERDEGADRQTADKGSYRLQQKVSNFQFSSASRAKLVEQVYIASIYPQKNRQSFLKKEDFVKLANENSIKKQLPEKKILQDIFQISSYKFSTRKKAKKQKLSCFCIGNSFRIKNPKSFSFNNQKQLNSLNVKKKHFLFSNLSDWKINKMNVKNKNFLNNHGQKKMALFTNNKINTVLRSNSFSSLSHSSNVTDSVPLPAPPFASLLPPSEKQGLLRKQMKEANNKKGETSCYPLAACLSSPSSSASLISQKTIQKKDGIRYDLLLKKPLLNLDIQKINYKKMGYFIFLKGMNKMNQSSLLKSSNLSFFVERHQNQIKKSFQILKLSSKKLEFPQDSFFVPLALNSQSVSFFKMRKQSTSNWSPNQNLLMLCFPRKYQITTPGVFCFLNIVEKFFKNKTMLLKNTNEVNLQIQKRRRVFNKAATQESIKGRLLEAGACLQSNAGIKNEGFDWPNMNRLVKNQNIDYSGRILYFPQKSFEIKTLNLEKIISLKRSFFANFLPKKEGFDSKNTYFASRACKLSAVGDKKNKKEKRKQQKNLPKFLEDLRKTHICFFQSTFFKVNRQGICDKFFHGSEISSFPPLSTLALPFTHSYPAGILVKGVTQRLQMQSFEGFILIQKYPKSLHKPIIPEKISFTKKTYLTKRYSSLLQSKILKYLTKKREKNQTLQLNPSFNFSRCNLHPLGLSNPLLVPLRGSYRGKQEANKNLRLDSIFSSPTNYQIYHWGQAQKNFLSTILLVSKLSSEIKDNVNFLNVNSPKILLNKGTIFEDSSSFVSKGQGLYSLLSPLFSTPLPLKKEGEGKSNVGADTAALQAQREQEEASEQTENFSSTLAPSSLLCKQKDLEPTQAEVRADNNEFRMQVKNGWVYIPLNELKAVSSHRTWVQAGKAFVDDLSFDKNIVYVEALEDTSNSQNCYKQIAFALPCFASLPSSSPITLPASLICQLRKALGNAMQGCQQTNCLSSPKMSRLNWIKSTKVRYRPQVQNLNPFSSRFFAACQQCKGYNSGEGEEGAGLSFERGHFLLLIRNVHQYFVPKIQQFKNQIFQFKNQKNYKSNLTSKDFYSIMLNKQKKTETFIPKFPNIDLKIHCMLNDSKKFEKHRSLAPFEQGQEMEQEIEQGSRLRGQKDPSETTEVVSSKTRIRNYKSSTSQKRKRLRGILNQTDSANHYFSNQKMQSSTFFSTKPVNLFPLEVRFFSSSNFSYLFKIPLFSLNSFGNFDLYANQKQFQSKDLFFYKNKANLCSYILFKTDHFINNGSLSFYHNASLVLLRKRTALQAPALLLTPIARLQKTEEAIFSGFPSPSPSPEGARARVRGARNVRVASQGKREGLPNWHSFSILNSNPYEAKVVADTHEGKTVGGKDLQKFDKQVFQNNLNLLKTLPNLIAFPCLSFGIGQKINNFVNPRIYASYFSRRNQGKSFRTLPFLTKNLTNKKPTIVSPYLSSSTEFNSNGISSFFKSYQKRKNLSKFKLVANINFNSKPIFPFSPVYPFIKNQLFVNNKNRILSSSFFASTIFESPYRGEIVNSAPSNWLSLSQTKNVMLKNQLILTTKDLISFSFSNRPDQKLGTIKKITPMYPLSISLPFPSLTEGKREGASRVSEEGRVNLEGQNAIKKEGPAIPCLQSNATLVALPALQSLPFLGRIAPSIPLALKKQGECKEQSKGCKQTKQENRVKDKQSSYRNLIRFKQKIFKVKGLNLGFPSKNKRSGNAMCLGKFMFYGDSLFPLDTQDNSSFSIPLGPTNLFALPASATPIPRSSALQAPKPFPPLPRRGEGVRAALPATQGKQEEGKASEAEESKKLVKHGRKDFAINQAGLIIHLNQFKITLRKGQPFFVSPKAILHQSHGEFVQKNESVVTLAYQRVKTGDIVQGIPKIEQIFEARTTKRGRLFRDSLPHLLENLFLRYKYKLSQEKAVRQSYYKIRQIIVDGVQRVYRSQGVSIADKHIEVIVKEMTSKVRIINRGVTAFFPGEFVDLDFVEHLNTKFIKKIKYEPIVLGISKASLSADSFLSSASFQHTIRVLSRAAIYKKRDFLRGLKENVIVGNLIPAGTGFLTFLDDRIKSRSIINANNRE